MKEKILVVDDERTLRELVRSTLLKEGFQVSTAEDAESALSVLDEDNPALVILDIEMPGISGLKLLENIRKRDRNPDVPVLMLTVLGDEAHKVRGFDAGADDYLVKPFAANELLARVQAVLRRAKRGSPADVKIRSGRIEVDVDRREVLVHGERVKVTVMEFNLLLLFLKRRGFVLSYDSLSESLSQGGKVMTSENLYTHVKNLRRVLGEAGKTIETVHGIGYKYVEPA